MDVCMCACDYVCVCVCMHICAYDYVCVFALEYDIVCRTLYMSGCVLHLAGKKDQNVT